MTKRPLEVQADAVAPGAEPLRPLLEVVDEHAGLPLAGLALERGELDGDGTEGQAEVVAEVVEVGHLSAVVGLPAAPHGLLEEEEASVVHEGGLRGPQTSGAPSPDELGESVEEHGAVVRRGGGRGLPWQVWPGPAWKPDRGRRCTRPRFLGGVS
jgi:hypothetical protein